MQAYGSDRVRLTAGKLILHSRLSKGWVARIAKSATHAEFPGTAVYWDEQYYEVLAAEPLPAGGVRYVLIPWNDSHTMRTFLPYDGESEARLVADHALAERQRRNSGTAKALSMFAGHLPANVQNHMGNELGVRPPHMTLWSMIPAVALPGVLVWMGVSGFMGDNAGAIGLILIAAPFMVETVIRLLIVMSQDRAVGSVLGTLAYLVYWALSPSRKRLVQPFAGERGFRTPTVLVPPSDEVAQRDALAVRAPFLTLLSPREQVRLAERFGFDYREHASEVAWAILGVGAIGVFSSWSRARMGVSGGLVSLVVAAFIVVEQAMRLAAFKRGPAGSVFGIVVRPFVRDLLERE
jgi:hypothetical protein